MASYRKDRDETALGRCYKVLQAGQDTPCAFCTNHLLVKGGRPQPTYAWEFRNTITGRWCLCVDQAIRWTDGRLVRMEVAVDISVRKQMERFREQYIGMVSHDLRNPLNFIHLACNHLAPQLAAANMARDVDLVRQMMRSTERMGAMIQDLTDSARIEAGELKLERELIDLAAVVRDLTIALGQPGDQERVVTEVRSDPVSVMGDRGRIERVLQNLVNNALKYSDPTLPVCLTLAEKIR